MLNGLEFVSYLIEARRLSNATHLMTVLSWFQKSSLGSRTTTDFYPAGAKGRPRQSKARRGLDRFPTEKWTEVTMQVTKLLDAQSCDLRRVKTVQPQMPIPRKIPNSLVAPRD